MFAVIVYVLVSGCAWRSLPPCSGISKSTAHRRFLIWSGAGVWGRLHEVVLHRLADAGFLDVSRVILDTAHATPPHAAGTRRPWLGPGRVSAAGPVRETAGRSPGPPLSRLWRCPAGALALPVPRVPCWSPVACGLSPCRRPLSFAGPCSLQRVPDRRVRRAVV